MLVCTECRYCYPIRDGLPYLLVDEALPPEETTSEPNRP